MTARSDGSTMSERSRLRLAILQVLVLSLFATLLARLYFLQVLAGEQYDLIAQNNNRREVVEPAPRGRLLDDRGRPLVTNRTALVVTVSYAEMQKQEDKGQAVLTRLSRIIGVPYPVLAQMIKPCGPDSGKPCWRGSPFQPVPVAEDVAPDVAFRIEEHREEFPGVEAGLQAVRTYPLRTLGAHLLGYVSPISQEELEQPDYRGYRQTALVGRGGLEEQYERYLRGRDGVQTVAVNRLGRVTSVLDTTDPIPGNDVVLALDVEVQKVLERALGNAISRARATVEKDTGKPFRAPAAAGVVLEVSTGRVVAMSSLPAYDPSLFIGGISEKDYARLTSSAASLPLSSRATQGLFAPGSTFKVVSTASSVTAGQASLGGSYACPGQLKVGDRTFRNFESRPLGSIALHTALVKSCDTVFYQFAYNDWLAGSEALQAMARAFGFGSGTGIDLPSESAGRIVDRDFKRTRWEEKKAIWCERAKQPTSYQALDQENCTDGFRYRAGDHVNLSIGQGETVVTPLQLAVAYAAIANGGTVYEPRLAKAIVGPDGRVLRQIAPKAKGRLPVSPELLAYVRAALTGVTTEGTAHGAFAGFPHHLLPVAGKTGTAQVSGKQDTSWFAAFAPAHAPRYAVVVMTEEAGQGGLVSAPAVREVFEGIYGIGRAPALPGGVPPAALPKIAPDGTVTGPKLPSPTPLVPPAPSPSPSVVALPERRRGL